MAETNCLVSILRLFLKLREFLSFSCTQATEPKAAISRLLYRRYGHVTKG